jgi:anti-sigma B factor antagonist
VPFQKALHDEKSSTIILDFTDVPYIDSAGLGSLVTAYVSRHKAGRTMALSGVNRRVLKLFEITRVEPLLLIFPTLEDAVEALTHAAQA